MTGVGHIQSVVDTTIATSALSSPLWLQAIEEGFHAYVLIGGCILLTLRIILAVRDFRAKKDQDE